MLPETRRSRAIGYPAVWRVALQSSCARASDESTHRHLDVAVGALAAAILTRRSPDLAGQRRD
jgi:hypothetical protein